MSHSNGESIQERKGNETAQHSCESVDGRADEKEFEYLVLPQTIVKGPPLPKILPYTTLPPVYRQIVENRRTPKYHLGWILTYSEFRQRYNPHGKWNSIVTAFSNSVQYQRWVQACGGKSLWMATPPTLLPTDDDEPNYILSLTFNIWQSTIDMTKDHKMIALAKEAFEQEQDPAWYQYKGF